MIKISEDGGSKTFSAEGTHSNLLVAQDAGHAPPEGKLNRSPPHLLNTSLCWATLRVSWEPTTLRFYHHTIPAKGLMCCYFAGILFGYIKGHRNSIVLVVDCSICGREALRASFPSWKDIVVDGQASELKKEQSYQLQGLLRTS
jgi:hypothetical protein